jgi:hypothetical protein
MADKKTKFELNDQTGFIFKNSYKKDGDNKPDFTGTCKVENKTYRVSLWKKITKKGDPMLSLSFSPSADEIKSTKHSAKPGQPLVEDDLPF